MSLTGNKTRDDLVLVARAVRTRGLKGELVADLWTDFPERFESTKNLCGVGPEGKLVQLELENHWFQNDRIVLKFAGHDTVEAARELVGYEFGVPEAERVKLSEGEFYDWELESCLVENQNGGPIGEVRAVVRTGGVEILAVKVAGRDDILIPMVGSIVVKVDIQRKRILVDPPEGLLDL
ncbi:MAG TPA: ribosome maturation factor RimM [Pyrinomonadaceae bacterium]|nr:ribosome maturation factor RimM [Pyrinomonadaceae bacterium]